MKGATASQVKLRPGMSIGNLSAETDDEFLAKCFVNNPSIDKCIALDSPGMIVFGSTGAGKTAIIKHIEVTKYPNVQIDPLDLALTYVANSDILRYLAQVGADVDLFFQILWKHVLCIEMIRIQSKSKGEDGFKHYINGLIERFGKDAKKKKTIDYLKSWDGKFWLTIDQSIKEIIQKYGEKVGVGIGVEPGPFTGKAEAASNSTQEIRSEIKERAHEVVNTDQLAALAGLIDILAEVGDGDAKMKEYYIMIDKLDEKWVDDAIKFRLIRALIQTLRPFRRIKNFKILVALRADILERTLLETKDHTFQREKFDDYIVRLKWTKAQLKEIIDRRIQYLFKHKYTTEDISFSNLFDPKIHNEDMFDYICERTLMRPRDLISFVNECFEFTDGTYKINASAVQQGESVYSRKRRQALEDEWHSVYPCLSTLLQFLGSVCEAETQARRRAVITFAEFCNKTLVDELALQVASEQTQIFDALRDAAVKYIDQPNNVEFAKGLISIFYRVGAIGIKPRPGDNYIYAAADMPVMDHSIIIPETKIRVHPILHAALGIKEK